jgi:lipopolysaccharide/colanic/teichoic acid biosynthesis glycosyltransferase
MVIKNGSISIALLNNKQGLSTRGSSTCPEFEAQERFLRSLYLEERRSERSGRRFVLMLLESANLFGAGDQAEALGQLLKALRSSIRETDIIGWHEEGSVLGIIFTEIGEADGNTVAGALLTKVATVLASTLRIEEISQVRLSLHIFPEDWSGNGNNRLHEPAVFPDTMPGACPKNGLSTAKRLVDITGSILALLLFSPLLFATAIAVKLTSKGPVFFKQKRVGQYGRSFTFLKFRSMYCQSDDAVHQDYMKHFIAGDVVVNEPAGDGRTVYKLTRDPRLTSIGGFLRRSSLDELPQLLNVLRGDMSLVGPRPPIPYEVNCYSAWHRRRLWSVKPGITGLWQVTGRSSVSFDEMVRLDLRYAKSWSLWLDTKILLKTPMAVLGGEGAW